MPPPPTALHCSSPPPSGGGPRYAGANERGAALVISLVLLAVMTLFGISMVNTTLLEERMASNQRDTDIAFQATEAALRDAERYLQTQCDRPDPATDPVIWPAGEPADAGGTPLEPASPAWWAIATAYGGALGNVAAQPRFTIEEVSYDATTKSALYRVTARGTGSGNNATVVQTYYRHTFANTVIITGSNGADVVALADGVIAVDVSLAGLPDIDLSLGGYLPTSCGNTDLNIYFDGNGGLDTFVVANLADVGYDSDPNMQLIDLAGLGLPDLVNAVTNFHIRDVFVENPGSTATLIANTNLLSNFAEDNTYCINTAQTASSGLLHSLVGDLLPNLLRLPVLGSLTPVVDLVDALLDGVIGPSGMLPVLPLAASLIADVDGDDRYIVHSDMSTGAYVVADVAGDDTYEFNVHGTLLDLPVFVDIDGVDSFTVNGSDYIKVELDGAVASQLANAVTSLDNLTSVPVVGPIVEALLLNPLTSTISDILGASCPNVLNPQCLIQPVLQNIVNLLQALLVGNNLGPSAATPATWNSGVCAVDPPGRLSWRQVR